MRSFDAVLSGDWPENGQDADQSAVEVGEASASLEDAVAVVAFELVETPVVDHGGQQRGEVNGGGG